MRRYLTSHDDHPPAKRPARAPVVNAVIYEWVLDRIEPEHPLFHISYIGQAIRSGKTHKEAFEIRTRQHVYDATRSPKELGLHWAIACFGVEAFTVNIVEINTLPRTDAMAWANERETALIAERGGVMKNREPLTPIRQTLNLTSGGQGDPRSRWEAMEARSESAWQTIRGHLQVYYEEHEDLRVPESYKTLDEFPLGKTVQNMRVNKDYLAGHPNRITWVEERGFKMHAKNAMKDAERWAQLLAA
jgi:hypothetical protein